jgi:hypothetical protein
MLARDLSSGRLFCGAYRCARNGRMREASSRWAGTGMDTDSCAHTRAMQRSPPSAYVPNFATPTPRSGWSGFGGPNGYQQGTHTNDLQCRLAP